VGVSTGAVGMLVVPVGGTLPGDDGVPSPGDEGAVVVGVATVVVGVATVVALVGVPPVVEVWVVVGVSSVVVVACSVLVG
jgi:hypothetical protein